MMANYAKIKHWDIANGEGIGVSVYFSGCDKEPKCKGCFNSEIWDFNTGKPFQYTDKKLVVDMLDSPYVSHLAILGGEPLAYKNMIDVFDLCRWVKNKYGDSKKIWLWTHYKWEDLLHMGIPEVSTLTLVDVLVDGEYIEKQRDLTLKWRGSRNQRVIDVQKSLMEGRVVLYE